MNTRAFASAALAAAAIALLHFDSHAQGRAASPPKAAASQPFRIEETTISRIHAAMKDGRLTCRALVDEYLRRIDAYDKNGPALNAIVVVNADARQEPDDLDRRFAAGGLTGPLHCVPTIVKDNFETIGLQSADGSLSLEVEPTGDPDVEHWSLFLPDARVVVAGPGKTLHIARADEPDLWGP